MRSLHASSLYPAFCLGYLIRDPRPSKHAASGGKRSPCHRLRFPATSLPGAMSSGQHHDAAPPPGSAHSRFRSRNLQRTRTNPTTFKPLRRFSTRRPASTTAHQHASIGQGLNTSIHLGQQHLTGEASGAIPPALLPTSGLSSAQTTPTSTDAHLYRSNNPLMNDQASAARLHRSRMTLDQHRRAATASPTIPSLPSQAYTPTSLSALPSHRIPVEAGRHAHNSRDGAFASLMSILDAGDAVSSDMSSYWQQSRSDAFRRFFDSDEGRSVSFLQGVIRWVLEGRPISLRGVGHGWGGASSHVQQHSTPMSAEPALTRAYRRLRDGPGFCPPTENFLEALLSNSSPSTMPNSAATRAVSLSTIPPGQVPARPVLTPPRNWRAAPPPTRLPDPVRGHRNADANSPWTFPVARRTESDNGDMMDVDSI